MEKWILVSTSESGILLLLLLLLLFFSAEVISVLMLMLLQGKRPAKCLQELSLPSGLGRPACCSSVVATSGIVRFR